MALTPSTMLELGTPAPAFSLKDPDGRTVTLDAQTQAAATLIIFMCNHCPYVILLKEALAKLGHNYTSKGVNIIAINSNDPQRYPDDNAAKMHDDIRKFGYPFPYLIDADQKVAHAYRAACTPDFFLFGPDLKLAYRGQFDDSRPGNGKPTTGRDLRAALDAILAGESVSPEQKPSMGCNIKWLPGNEPDYFG